MAYTIAVRTQMKMLPPVIDDYVGLHDPVRVYDAFVDALDFKKLGISLEPKAGADEYYPKDMLKLFIYGYSYGVRSSRKLEQACHHNLSFIWIMGDLKPDYRTIARFRDRYKEQIKTVLKQSVELCMKMDLIEGNVLFTDGSKIRANASIQNTWTKERCQKALERIHQQVDELVETSERLDQEEEQEASLIKLKKKVHDKERFIEQIKETMRQLETSSKDSINTVDPDCVKTHGRQGSHASYNAQIVVDDKHGLIVAAESVSHSNDLNQLSASVTAASDNLGKKPTVSCSDAGYHSIEDLKKIDPQITVIVPSKAQAHHEKYPEDTKPFAKEHFEYDSSTDQYTCPEGKILKRTTQNPGGHGRCWYEYKTESRDCRPCHHFGVCTSSPTGRSINRQVDEPFKEQLEAIYQSPAGQEIYKRRKEKVELPFGHLKRNLNAGQFLLKGRAGTNAELSILSTCFNIARMITIMGIPQLLLHLRGT